MKKVMIMSMLILITGTTAFAQEKKWTPVQPSGRGTSKNSPDTTAKPVKVGRGVGDVHETSGDGLKKRKGIGENEGRPGYKK